MEGHKRKRGGDCPNEGEERFVFQKYDGAGRFRFLRQGRAIVPSGSHIRPFPLPISVRPSAESHARDRSRSPSCFFQEPTGGCISSAQRHILSVRSQCPDSGKGINIQLPDPTIFQGKHSLYKCIIIDPDVLQRIGGLKQLLRQRVDLHFPKRNDIIAKDGAAVRSFCKDSVFPQFLRHPLALPFVCSPFRFSPISALLNLREGSAGNRAGAGQKKPGVGCGSGGPANSELALCGVRRLRPFSTADARACSPVPG